MKIADLVDKLPLEVLACENNLEKNVTGGYCSDLLSVVMSSAKEGQVWITLQGHPNIIAIAVLLNLSAIIISEKSKVDEETIEKAKEEDVVVLTTELTSYEIVGRLYKLGIYGETDA